MNDFDEIQVLWHTIAELQLEIEYAGTGHVRTTINTLLDYVRDKEKNLSDIDRTVLELIAPNRWEHDWCAVV